LLKKEKKEEKTQAKQTQKQKAKPGQCVSFR
jgi:hypothetical protein